MKNYQFNIFTVTQSSGAKKIEMSETYDAKKDLQTWEMDSWGNKIESSNFDLFPIEQMSPGSQATIHTAFDTFNKIISFSMESNSDKEVVLTGNEDRLID